MAREQRVSRTAQWVAAYRALETVAPHEPPLFTDPFATRFLSSSLRLAIRAARIGPIRKQLLRYSDRRAPGARTSAIGRTAFIDEAVRRAVARGTRQLVVLGAGYDCRAHRMPELAGTTVFEIDRPEIQATKRARLDRKRGKTTPDVRRDVRYVAVDFLQDDLGEKLAQHDWDRSAPTLFIWEGVTNYLTESAVSDVLSWIGKSAPGSTLVFTYIHGGLLDGSVSFDGGEKMMRSVREIGEPWRFGLHPEKVAAFLAPFGLELKENLGADEYRRRYLGASEPDAQGYAFYRIAVAEVAPLNASTE